MSRDFPRRLCILSESLTDFKQFTINGDEVMSSLARDEVSSDLNYQLGL